MWLSPTKVYMESIAVIAACWAIISGAGAWKYEFIRKLRIEFVKEI
jgi:5-keto 4-deoxyuronate isomerase